MSLQRPTGGELHRHLGREGISYVPQTFSLAPDLTVEENLRFQGGLYGLPDLDSRMTSLLESVDLAAFRTRLSGALSGGMKQKLALCAALLTRPRLLLLDEPTTGVDPVSRREFWELIHEVHDQGVAVLFSTPYMDEAPEPAGPGVPAGEPQPARGTEGPSRSRAAGPVRGGRDSPRPFS